MRWGSYLQILWKPARTLISVLNPFWASPWFYPSLGTPDWRFYPKFSPGIVSSVMQVWVSVSLCKCVWGRSVNQRIWIMSLPPPPRRSLVPQMVRCCRGERTGPPLFNAVALWRPAPFHLPFSSGCSTTNQGWCERGEKHKRNRGKCWPAGRGRDGAWVGEFIATGQLSRLLVCLSGSFIWLSLQ